MSRRHAGSGKKRLSTAREGDLAKRIQILNELMRVAVSRPNVAEVFDGVGRHVKELIDYDWMDITRLSPDENTFSLYAIAGSPITDLERGTLVPLSDSPVGEAILTGRAILRTRIPEDNAYPMEDEIAKVSGCRSAMFVPLASKGRAVGTLNFGSREHGRYTKSDVKIAEEIADHLAVIVENAWLYEQSKELAKLEERNRLAREIHDTLAQSLTSIVVRLEGAEALLAKDIEMGRTEVRSARELARESLEEVRRSVWGLRPLTLATSNLTEAIRWEVSKLRGEGVEASLRVQGDRPTEMDPRCDVAVLRVVQEGLNNVLRHAKAGSVAVRLVYSPDHVQLRISDDGVGFDPSSATDILSPAGGGFGLTSMQERARVVGGHMIVRSSPGRGTQLEADIPYQPHPPEAPSLSRTSVIAAPQPESESSHIRVLIVDDHEVARQGIRSMLERSENVTVVGEADDGEQAIELIQSLTPDVVLMDIQMPRLNGVEALRRLGDLGLEARVILLSVYEADEQVFEGLRAGARGYLLKDVSRDELVHAIQAVHEGGSSLQPTIAGRLIERLDKGEPSRLTQRELEVLRLLASGARNKEIARHLSLSVHTVKFHVENIYSKLDVQSRAEAVRVAGERGLLRT